MFMLMASMMTGVPEIDAEHRELVEIINILAAAEQQRRNEEALAALERFQRELQAHFQREEAYLEAVRFPGQAAHAAHHAETLRRLQEIQHDFSTQPDGQNAAATCFDELLRVVLKQDLEAVNWLAEAKLRRK